MRLPAPLLRRKPNVHKKDFGHLLVLAGCRRMSGAAALCANAAIRSGAGLVTAGIPQSVQPLLQRKLWPVIMTLPLKATPQGGLAYAAYTQLKTALEQFTVVAIGPGLGREASTRRLVLKIIESVQKPLVIDADALNALSLSGKTVLLKTGRAPRILTPHPGEMARLTGLTTAAVQKNRCDIARRFAMAHGVTVVLKGHRTVIASPEGKTALNRTGNAGMATAGTGDVLTGIIAALLCQGMEAFEAARLGAYLHGKAGDLAAGRVTRACLTAMDMIEEMPKAFKQASQRPGKRNT